MKTFYINNIPCALYGEPAKGVYLYVHGQYSCKEAAESFAEVFCLKISTYTKFSTDKILRGWEEM